MLIVQSSNIRLVLENSSSTPVDLVKLSFDDSTAREAQTVIAEGELAPEHAYELDWDQINRPALTWENPTETNIPPGGRATLLVKCLGKVGWYVLTLSPSNCNVLINVVRMGRFGSTTVTSTDPSLDRPTHSILVKSRFQSCLQSIIRSSPILSILSVSTPPIHLVRRLRATGRLDPDCRQLDRRCQTRPAERRLPSR